MKIAPAPGRIVWFHPGRGSSLFKELKNSSTPLGAMVAQVNDDDTINLCVASSRGDSVAVQNVQLIQDDEPKPEFGSVNFARWMPYQVGQAKKERDAEQRSSMTGRSEQTAARGQSALAGSSAGANVAGPGNPGEPQNHAKPPEG